MSDSYAATRIHVMRTKLIQPEEYDKLLKMSDKEIVNYLQSTEYKEDVDALAIKDLEDLEMVDKILSANRERVVQKLQRISRGAFLDVLDELLRRNDLRNIMLVAEAMSGKKDARTEVKAYGQYGTLDMEPFLKAENFKDLAQLVAETFSLEGSAENFVEFKRLMATIPSVKETHLRTDAVVIDEFNILDLVRFKRENIPPETILANLQDGGTIHKKILKKAANAADVKGTLQALTRTQYADVVERALEHFDKGNLVRFESDLRKVVIARIRKLTHLYPLGVELLIHFLAEKNTEHENLRLLIKGKRLGLSEGFVRNYLIT